MLLSPHIRLVAEFDHRHVFLDAAPESTSSFDERKCLFGLPRSSWADYDPALISPGGGVHSRQAKTIKITEQVRICLDLEPGTTSLPPHSLITLFSGPLLTCSTTGALAPTSTPQVARQSGGTGTVTCGLGLPLPLASLDVQN